MANIESIIEESLNLFNSLNHENKKEFKNEIKLIFPSKSDGISRVSEQEIRFLFINLLDKKTGYFYSVEAPTKEKYNFTGKDGNERSGNIDVCIYENNKRKHLIEFKALNPKQASFDKDFEKLFLDEKGLTNYFVHVVDKFDNKRNSTLLNIEKKYREAINHVKEKPKIDMTSISNLIIFLYDNVHKKLYKYEVKNFILTKL